MDDDFSPTSPPSFKQKLKESLCCFRRRNHHPLPSPSDDNPAVIWIETKGPHHHSLSQKCRTMLGFPPAKHKRQSSLEFHYDPLSYALNFEDGFDCDDEAPLKSFNSRLPPSPAVN